MSTFIDDFIEESGMKFGAFAKDVRFKVENSQIHKSLGKGFKIVEFIALKENRIIFVEAKSKGFIPNISVEYLDSKIKDIAEKFENSADLFLSVYIKWQADKYSEIGDRLLNANYSKITGIFYLVINGADDSICMELTKMLQAKLKRKLTIHNFNLLVINNITASEYGLIS
ncbi:MAG: hypothetical protein FWG90_11250 [Oscillospiraceae bacterium]|nr:hypothetical protein [Oscillospiraceae bacterium]